VAKFVVKNPFYWRGKLVEAGAVIDAPKGVVDDLQRKDVLGDSLEEKPPAKKQEKKQEPPETATQSGAPESTSLPSAKKE